MPGTDAPTEMLMSYAVGALSPGLSLLMTAHLERADASRDMVADFEALGGSLLEGEEPAVMSGDALDCVLHRLEEEVAESAVVTVEDSLKAGPLPQTVIEAIGTDFDKISWRFRLPGVSEYELGGFSGERVSLLRAKPGSRIPQHTHDGIETTLILTGAMRDGDQVFRAGDIAVATEDDDHRPEIIGEETCHCLVVMTGQLRFTGRFSRALNYLAE